MTRFQERYDVTKSHCSQHRLPKPHSSEAWISFRQQLIFVSTTVLKCSSQNAAKWNNPTSFPHPLGMELENNHFFINLTEKSKAAYIIYTTLACSLTI